MIWNRCASIVESSGWNPNYRCADRPAKMTVANKQRELVISSRLAAGQAPGNPAIRETIQTQQSEEV
jgi:hypothetical protein